LGYLYHMRAVLQRVSRAHVEVEGEIVGQIAAGLLVLLGIEQRDTTRDADYLVKKIAGLRIFPDENGRMNRSLVDTDGGLLVISQFTLYGDCTRGARPSFDRAANSESARELYNYFVTQARILNSNVATGVFQASMSVYLINEGPVTIICESVPPLEQRNQ
jgi:D-aminoacyl-tRNA deacylase